MRVTVLGAGYMGSAMAQVAAMRGHDVRLWGTWLDDVLIEAVEQKRDHPRLRMALDSRVAPFRAGALADALDGAELVVHALSSEGAVPVMTMAAAHLPYVPILSVTKGFLPTKSGATDRIDVVVSEALGRRLRFVHAAGPAKAVEVARRVLTWMYFASADLSDARAAADAVGGDHLRVTVSDDIAGAEICSALRTPTRRGSDSGTGTSDRTATTRAPRASNRRSSRWRGSWRRAAVASRRRSPRPASAICTSPQRPGEIRAFGERVGRGRPAKEVAAEMLSSGNLTEGYPAIKSAWRWAAERGVGDLPLLEAIHAIVWQGAEVGQTLAKIRLSNGGS